MQIHINTDEPLSDTDKQILAVLAGGVATAPAAASAKPAPAKKAAAAKPDPEPEDSTEDGGATLEDAKTLATKMVANGDAAKVKAALTKVGAKKVSEIDEDKVDEFIAALD